MHSPRNSIRMITAKIGQRYRIIKLKTFFLLKCAVRHAVTSSSIFFTPITLDTRRQVAIAAIGIITEFVRKSKKSRNCIPMIFTPASGPYPREERLPRTSMITPTYQCGLLSAPFQAHPERSIQHFRSEQSNWSVPQTVPAQRTKFPISGSQSHTCKDFRDRDKHQGRSCLQCIRISA